MEELELESEGESCGEDECLGLGLDYDIEEDKNSDSLLTLTVNLKYRQQTSDTFAILILYMYSLFLLIPVLCFDKFLMLLPIPPPSPFTPLPSSLSGHLPLSLLSSSHPYTTSRDQHMVFHVILRIYGVRESAFSTYQRRLDMVTDLRANCIPEHGLWRNVWGKRFFLVLSFSGRHKQKLVKVSHVVANR